MSQTQAFAKAKKVKLTISPKSVTLQEGKTKQVVVKYGSKKVQKKAKWTSGNQKVATVSKGKIKAVGAGKTVIKAKYKGKTVKCNVTVKKAGGSGSGSGSGSGQGGSGQGGTQDVIALSKTAAAIDSGSTLQLSLLKNGKEVSDVTWKSRNDKVASVSEKGLVTGNSDGKVDVFATYQGKSYICEVTVNGFVFKRDCTVTPGTVSKYIEFEINTERITAEELAAQDFTISEDGNTASATLELDTMTYSFKRLPKTLEEIKTIPLDTMFGPAAASICAVASYDTYSNIQSKKTDSLTFNQAFEYLNGPDLDISARLRQEMHVTLNQTFGYDSTGLGRVKGGPLMYFDGAGPKNGYQTNPPYQFTLREGAYYIPAQEWTYTRPNGEPEKRMVMIKAEGDDIERYLDVFYSGKDRCWYDWDDTCQHLTQGMKEATTTNW